MPKAGWSDDDLVEAVHNAVSTAAALRAIGLAPVGGNYRTFARHVKRLGLSTEHFTGKHRKGVVPHNARTLKEMLVRNSPVTNNKTVKRLLVTEGLLEDRCDECGVVEWKGRRLVLHLEHINGINTDYRLKNLRFLCPNCHSQTITYCRKTPRTLT